MCHSVPVKYGKPVSNEVPSHGINSSVPTYLTSACSHFLHFHPREKSHYTAHWENPRAVWTRWRTQNAEPLPEIKAVEDEISLGYSEVRTAQ
jgi:hypothetical protein